MRNLKILLVACWILLRNFVYFVGAMVAFFWVSFQFITYMEKTGLDNLFILGVCSLFVLYFLYAFYHLLKACWDDAKEWMVEREHARNDR